MSTPQNDAFQIRAPKPIDSRYLKNETIPWVSVAEVNAAIAAAYRYQGLTVLIVDKEYWYIGGTADGNLVPKTDSAISLELSADGFYTAPYDMLIAALIVTPDTGINFKAGSSAGAQDFVPELALQADIPAPITLFLVRSAGQTIHFSGISGSNTTIQIKTL
jgi:peptidoglycan hydrolase-like protein with peptidoglycan-binding domain